MRPATAAKLVSQTTRELLRDDPIEDVTLRDLGEHHLKDMDEPERIFQLVAPELVRRFPRATTAAPASSRGGKGSSRRRPCRRWRGAGGGRGRRALVAATFAAALMGAGVGVLLTQGGGSTASASMSANAVGVMDPNGRVIVGRDIGRCRAGRRAAGPKAIWVSNTDENTVSLIDPVDERRSDRRSRWARAGGRGRRKGPSG